MEKPEKFIAIVCEGQEIRGEMWVVPVKVLAYIAAEMDEYLASLTPVLDRETLIKIIYEHEDLLSDGFEYYDGERGVKLFADAIISAMYGEE